MPQARLDRLLITILASSSFFFVNGCIKMGMASHIIPSALFLFSDPVAC